MTASIQIITAYMAEKNYLMQQTLIEQGEQWDKF